MIRRAFTVLLYLVLLAVVMSCFHSIWVGLMARQRYQAVFPGAQGTMYWVTQSLSLAAGVNSILIALRKRWAILINPAIGVLSILAIEIIRGPRINEVVVLVACTLSTVIAWWLWGVRARVVDA
jgi:hypothetical protein